MPILPQEPDCYPADVLVSSAGYEPAAEPWWAVYTLSRREKDLLRRLRALDIGHYCPLVKKRQKSPSGRVRTSYVPLFAGYVFLRANEEQRIKALGTNCISKCLPATDAAGLVHDLRQIQRLIDAEQPLLPESRLEPGMRVRIKSGSLAGIEGVVLKRRGQERLMVAIGFLQQGASVLIEDFEVEQV